ncbi:sulfatase [Micromonosporaceae bacterium Da 78-11]
MSLIKRPATDQPETDRPGPNRVRRLLGVGLTVLAAALVFAALVVPEQVARPKAGSFVPGAFLRIPIEGILGAALLLALPTRWRRRAAVVLGLGLGGLAVLKVVNMGFRAVLGRKFNPVLDWPLFQDGYNALTETDGRTTAVAAVIGAILLSVTLLALLSLAVVRLAKVTVRYSLPARRMLIGLSAVWIAFALTGTAFFPNAPVASDSAAALVKTTAKQIPAAIRDQRQFAEESRTDAFRSVPDTERLAGLRGRDMVVGVVESYGRSSLEDPSMAAIVDPVLSAGTAKLATAGYQARSGFLTSSTYGGGSWLAHGSFQSGLWINSQQRYRQLIASDRLTLTKAFQLGGWDTVGVEPGNTVAWPEGDFYGYDSVYDSRNLGYRGPRFGWSRMPDQYTLSAFQRNVYGKPHDPLMAEITLTSSHEPWTPIPQTVDWDLVGDGSIFRPMALEGENRNVLWKNAAKTRIEYAKSIAYSVDNLVSWAEKYGDDNLVLVFFGDHQPISLVSGDNASRDVPITIVAHDPAVLDRIAGWGWQDGLKPDPKAPVWRMDEFRDKFFAAFGARPVAGRQPH